MKCLKCGIELVDDAKFCKECGQRVSQPVKRYCRECGAELDADAKFCKYCGEVVNLRKESITMGNGSSTEHKTVVVKIAASDNNNIVTNQSFSQETQDNQNRIYNKIGFGNNTILKCVIILCAIFLLFIIICLSISKMIRTRDENIDPVQSLVTSTDIDYSIDTTYTYAYMSDEWNVYIAIPISNSIIKIEHWDKTQKSTQKMTYNRDLGTYKLDDPDNGFFWVDDEHTAFVIKIQDNENSHIRKGKRVVFTINISDIDVCKGSDYDESIACYAYTNDEWHEYRAIPLTDKLIKVETWSRSNSRDSFLFGYDLFLINPQSEENDFEWCDDSHSAFTITTQDMENDYYWKKPSFVSFSLSNPNYTYSTVFEYLQSSTDLELPSVKEEKNGFDLGVNQIIVDCYNIDVPQYWDTDLEEDDHYRAYAERNGKSAMIDISAYDDEDEVTYDELEKENNNGNITSIIESWFSSCDEIDQRPFDNGYVKGFLYRTYFTLDDISGYCECLCYPSERSNKWIFVALMQSDNCDYSYISDFGRILSTIEANEEISVSENDHKEDVSVKIDANLNENNTAVPAEKIIIDYGDVEAFEGALNAGENLVGKVVRFVAGEIHPDSAFGHNIWAGDHVNFVSINDPGVKEGDVAVVLVRKTERFNESWIIVYQIVENAEMGDNTITSY